MLDANILIRGCLGVRVRALIADSAREVDFFVAEANASEASGYINELAARRGLDPQICQEAFLSLMEVVQIVDSTWIKTARDEALKRIRDPADWPALALPLPAMAHGAGVVVGLPVLVTVIDEQKGISGLHRSKDGRDQCVPVAFHCGAARPSSAWPWKGGTGFVFSTCSWPSIVYADG
ncbi:MAG: PIN domain-containing protein [Synechococcus sp.]